MRRLPTYTRDQQALAACRGDGPEAYVAGRRGRFPDFPQLPMPSLGDLNHIQISTDFALILFYGEIRTNVSRATISGSAGPAPGKRSVLSWGGESGDLEES